MRHMFSKNLYVTFLMDGRSILFLLNYILLDTKIIYIEGLT